MARESGRKLVASNRKARHDYHIDDTFEAGLVLTGTEVKALRAGRASLVDGYATVDNGEAWLEGVHIPEYTEGTWTNHAPRRKRKLLLHRREIAELEHETQATGAPTSPLAAADQTAGREITRFDVAAELGTDGVARVTLDFDFDFGNDPGRGPFLTLPTRQDAGEKDRLYRISGISASSSTGAPALVNREDDGAALVLRIGDPDIDDVSGVQTYRVEYTVDGWVNPASPQHSGDELYWNVIGSGWEVPSSGVTGHLTGPDAVQDAGCFAGPGAVHRQAGDRDLPAAADDVPVQ